MLDPVAVRSYLASLGQQQGGATGAGGVQAMLENLRQRLYGPQAAQGGGGGMPTAAQQSQIAQYVRNFPGSADQGQPANPAAGMPNGVPPRLQALAAKDPAAAQARYAQFQAGQLPGQQNQTQIASVPMAPAGRQMRQGGAVNVQGAGLPSSDMGGPGSDVGYQPADQPQFQLGGPFLSDPLPVGQNPAIQNGLTGFPDAGAYGDGPGSVFNPLPMAQDRPTFQSGGGLQAPQAGKPNMGRAPASPTVLGADQFRGPNARRIVNARQGIFNNVQQALRRPPQQQAQQRPVAGGGKVGR